MSQQIELPKHFVIEVSSTFMYNMAITILKALYTAYSYSIVMQCSKKTDILCWNSQNEGCVISNVIDFGVWLNKYFTVELNEMYNVYAIYVYKKDNFSNLCRIGCDQNDFLEFKKFVKPIDNTNLQQFCVFCYSTDQLLKSLKQIYTDYKISSKTFFEKSGNSIRLHENIDILFKKNFKTFYIFFSPNSDKIFITTEYKKSLYKDIPQVPHKFLQFKKFYKNV